MSMNPRLMRPTRSRPKPATPSITVTQQGIDPIAGVAERFEVSGGIDEQVTFSDGEYSGAVTFDASGNVSSIDATPTIYGADGSTGNPSLGFVALSVGGLTDMAKTSGGGGDIAVTQQGGDEVAGLQEVAEISFGGATGGTIHISEAIRSPGTPIRRHGARRRQGRAGPQGRGTAYRRRGRQVGR